MRTRSYLKEIQKVMEEELVTWVGDVKDSASDPKPNNQKVPGNPMKQGTMNRYFPEEDTQPFNKYIKRCYVQTSAHARRNTCCCIHTYSHTHTHMTHPQHTHIQVYAHKI